MEVKFLNITTKNLFKNLNLEIKSSQITGIYKVNNILIDILLNKIDYTGNVLINDLEVSEYEKNLISYIGNLDNKTFLTKKVSDEFYLVKNKISESEKSYVKKVAYALEMVGLSETYLGKDINTLSKSEKRLLQISTSLITNPDIIIIMEPLLYLSKEAKFNISKLLLELKRKYKKTIIILSDDINVLYELSNNLIIFKDDKVLISDTTNSVFKDIEFLEKNEIVLPDLILFNKIALNYNRKISNYKDIKDLIKEVYRNVSETKKET